MGGEKLTPVVSAQQQGPPPAEAASSELWLKGHINHFTQAEQKAFDEFKKLCTDKGHYTPATADKKASHDDGTLVRFLRARRFVPQDALVQFRDTEKWRKSNDLEALYEKIDIKEYWESRSVYPQWTGRRDKRGIPVYLYEVHKLNSKKMLAYSTSTSKNKEGAGSASTRMLRLFALYENLTRFVMPMCSAVPSRPNSETPVDQSNNIVDISKVGLKQFWNLRSHMQDASQLATAHYPETLDRIFILGAPSFFPTVWGWIKKWFDPITTSKIFILSHHQVLPTLTQFIDIENIPKKYGGKLDFECGDAPRLDPEIRAFLTFNKGLGKDDEELEKFFLTTPVRWVDEQGQGVGMGEEGELTALGVGTWEGKQRREEIATLHSLATRIKTSASKAGEKAAAAVAEAANTTIAATAMLQQQNGAPPTAPVDNVEKVTEKTTIAIPPPAPPTEMERTKTEFKTPFSDPAELKKELAVASE